MNVAGFAVTQLTQNTISDESTAWSPDGSKIAFESARSGNFEIYAINANGTGITRITSNSAFDGQPAWGPQWLSLSAETDIECGSKAR